MKNTSTISKKIIAGMMAVITSFSVLAVTASADNTRADALPGTAVTEQQPAAAAKNEDRGFIFKENGEYYIDVGAGIMTIEAYGYFLEDLQKLFGTDVTLEFAMNIDPNPHMPELIRVYGVWGVVNFYQKWLDNPDTSSLQRRYTLMG